MKYSILYCDPPWAYRNNGRGAAANHYRTMPDASLVALPIGSLGADDSIMFMWATWPNLPTCLATMAAWEYTYKTLAFLWVKYREKSGKNHMGGGFWTRANSELCLLGVRGDIRRVNAAVRQLVEEESDDRVIRAPIERHSAKPPEVRDRIVQLMGDLPRVELFARERAVGWDAWGDEVPGGSDVVLGCETISQNSLDMPETVAVERRSSASSVAPEVRENENDHTKENENMANLPKELAEEVGKARVAGGGVFINYGTYVLMNKKWWYQKTQDRCIIMKNLVIEAKRKPVMEGDKKVDVDPNAAGSEVDEVANFDGDGKLSAASNARAPVVGLFGLNDQKVPDAKVTETLDYCCDESKQPAMGMLVICDTYPKKIRNPSNPDRQYLVGRNWECVSPPGQGLNAPDKVKARVDALAKGNDEALRVTLEQIEAARKDGTFKVIGEGTFTVALPTNGHGAAAGGPPEIPSDGPPEIPNADPMARFLADGWKPHPKSPVHFWKGKELKTKDDLLAGR